MQNTLFIFFIILLNSCGTPKETTNSDKQEKLENSAALSGKYFVSEMGGKTPNIDLFMEFDANTGRVSGFSGCNNFFGSYDLNGNNLNFRTLASTKKYCQGELNVLENEMMTLLKEVNVLEKNESFFLLKNKAETLFIIKAAAETLKVEKSKINKTTTYEASSRGFYEKLWMSGNTIYFTKDRYGQEVLKNNIPKDKLNELERLIEAFSEKELSNLEPPSKAFQYDGAPMATLKIDDGKTTFQTQTFDHGNPPIAIKSLVKMMLDLKKSILE
ncbi:MAG: META domain-containing protein [Bacteroidota bacterium]